MDVMHGRVLDSWKQLTEIRFKLVALLPLVSGVGIYQLLAGDSAIASAGRWAKAMVCVFGITVTFAILLYERRNSELYDDLVSVGRRLEHDAGIRRGVFSGRLSGSWPFRHDVALKLIYGAVLTAWLFTLIAAVKGTL